MAVRYDGEVVVTPSLVQRRLGWGSPGACPDGLPECNKPFPAVGLPEILAAVTSGATPPGGSLGNTTAPGASGVAATAPAAPPGPSMGASYLRVGLVVLGLYVAAALLSGEGIGL